MQSVVTPRREPADPLSAVGPHGDEVRAHLRQRIADRAGDVYALVAYHLGWRDASGAPCDERAGKMLRPALLLTVAEGYARGDGALDAAAAVELLHAFSLVHDDIEDGDCLRHARPTLWASYGMPLALNAGDSLFALANDALIDAATHLPADRLRAVRAFNDACLRMIEGQHADLSYETSGGVTVAAYEEMTRGKTGALIGACFALGAIFGGAPERDVDRLHEAGLDLGAAFQAVDDGLAVWGDSARIGKNVGNDEARGKQSLPVVLARGRELEPGDGPVRAACAAWAAERAERAVAAVEGSSMTRPAKERIALLTEFILRRAA